MKRAGQESAPWTAPEIAALRWACTQSGAKTWAEAAELYNVNGEEILFGDTQIAPRRYPERNWDGVRQKAVKLGIPLTRVHSDT